MRPCVPVAKIAPDDCVAEENGSDPFPLLDTIVLFSITVLMVVIGSSLVDIAARRRPMLFPVRVVFLRAYSAVSTAEFPETA